MPNETDQSLFTDLPEQRLPYTSVHYTELARQRAQAQSDLEQIMDRYTWDGFITMLSEICYIKSDRAYQLNPKDKSAKIWHRVGVAFSKLHKLQPNS